MTELVLGGPRGEPSVATDGAWRDVRAPSEFQQLSPRVQLPTANCQPKTENRKPKTENRKLKTEN